MTKTQKIIYWIATLWLSLGMVATGIVQISKSEHEVNNIIHLGYPVYFLTMLGIWKILGVVAILAPKFAVLRNGHMLAFSLPCLAPYFLALHQVIPLVKFHRPCYYWH